MPVTLLVALGRDAPIVRLRDQGFGLLLLVGGIVALAAVGARLLSNQLARRLEPLADASRSVAGGDMKARVPQIGDPDLDAVGSAFNDMAAELETTRDREREFILGVGHDLRTPLTTIGGYAEALETGDLGEEELTRIGVVLGAQTRQIGAAHRRSVHIGQPGAARVQPAGRAGRRGGPCDRGGRRASHVAPPSWGCVSRWTQCGE